MKTIALCATLFVGAFLILTPASAAPNGHSCWGQATKVIVQTGVMGEHASEQVEPTLTALGAFVAGEPGLTIDACMTNPPLALEAAEAAVAANAACWGQVSRVFAPMGLMGEHSSHQESPRLGCRPRADPALRERYTVATGSSVRFIWKTGQSASDATRHPPESCST